MSSLFDALVERIEVAYERLGHQLGWRFITTPRSTLSPTTRLAFVALNPGGRSYEPPLPSVEEGNAYRLEGWDRSGGLSRLQTQVVRLYDGLAQDLQSSPDQLMDETLAGYFCPFRSPEWSDLANRSMSIAFSRDLWRTILSEMHLPAIVCLSEAAKEIRQILTVCGAPPTAPARQVSLNWDVVNATLSYHQSERGPTLVAGLPHLSRFSIFGRPASGNAVGEITAAVAAVMTATR